MNKKQANEIEKFQARVQSASVRLGTSPYAEVMETHFKKAAESANYDTFALGYVSGSATAISVLMAALSGCSDDKKVLDTMNRAFGVAIDYLRAIAIPEAQSTIVAHLEQAKVLERAARTKIEGPCEGPEGELCEGSPRDVQGVCDDVSGAALKMGALS